MFYADLRRISARSANKMACKRSHPGHGVPTRGPFFTPDPTGSDASGRRPARESSNSPPFSVRFGAVIGHCRGEPYVSTPCPSCFREALTYPALGRVEVDKGGMA